MTSPITQALADELITAHAERRQDVVPPTTRDGGLDLDTAYAIEGELVARRKEAGHRPVGVKVGYANRAMWRALKLETLVWASMYDDTVRFTAGGAATLSIGRMTAPKIEPEIVFKLKHAPTGDSGDPAAVLAAVEWFALGFEIIDSVYLDWKFQPADFVASYGLHAALVIGEPHYVQPDEIPALVEQLAAFTVSLRKGDTVVAEGAGKNSLKSPALCVGELGAAVARRAGVHSIAEGTLVSSGTLTEAQRIGAGEHWSAVVDGLDAGRVSVTTIA